jgi:hypothetical protein
MEHEGTLIATELKKLLDSNFDMWAKKKLKTKVSKPAENDAQF